MSWALATTLLIAVAILTALLFAALLASKDASRTSRVILGVLTLASVGALIVGILLYLVRSIVPRGA